MKTVMEYCYEDYLQNGTGQIRIVRDDGNISIDNLEKWFNPKYELSKLDIECLSKIKEGNVLDIACGTGVHMRYLQKRNREVYGFDISKFNIMLAQKLGTKNVYIESFWNFTPKIKFNNAICMNGSIGIVGDVNKVEDFLKKCKEFLKVDGYLYIQGVDWRVDPLNKHAKYIQNNIQKGLYPGNVIFHQEYKGIKDEDFKWTWVDTDTLKELAIKNKFEVVDLKYYGAKYFITLQSKM